MKVLSIIGIVLFSWLFFNRCHYYGAVEDWGGKSITYTDSVMNRAKQNLIPQILVSAYALIFAIAATVHTFKNQNIKNDIRSDSSL